MRFLFIALLVLVTSCKSAINPPGNPLKKVQDSPDELPFNTLNLPEGFKIEAYATEVDNARSMCLAPDGTLFVSTRGAGNVYALRDTDGDFKVDQKFTLLDEKEMPNGVAFKDGDLYVAEVSRILKFENILSKLDAPGEPTVVYDKFPTDTHHGWKFIDFGPDGKLYVPVGAPCNICESDEIYASLTRLDLETKNLEIVQHGIRNTVGFTWDPETKDLWFTDNGRDMMGDDMPGCELNHAAAEQLHFGYPYCHQGDVLDDKFGEGKNCGDYVAPAQTLGAHVAPLGLEFYKGSMFPSTFKNQIFIAEHGSWNRSKKSGYRVMMVELDENKKATSYKPFIDGWLDQSTDEVWGRPVDVEWMADGSMLVSDDYANAIYRVTYGD